MHVAQLHERGGGRDPGKRHEYYRHIGGERLIIGEYGSSEIKMLAGL